MNRLAVVLCIVMSFFMVSCATYSEDDALNSRYPSQDAFDLMNAKEKILHDKIAAQWGQSNLLTLRDAARKRKLVPVENEMAYGDMPGVIVTLNDVVLNAEGNGDNYKINRFNSLSPEWYRAIQKMADRGEQKTLKGTPPPPKPKPEEKEEVMEAKAANMPTTLLLHQPAPVVWDAEDIAPLDAVTASKMSLVRCERAQVYFDVIVEEERPVLIGDIQAMKEMFSICKAQELQAIYKD